MKKLIHITLVLLLSSLSSLAQTKETKQADTYFENLAYALAIDEYKKLAAEDATEHVLTRLADSYYYNTKMQEASETYQKLFAKFSVKNSEHIFRYAQTLRAIGNFEASDKWMQKFHEADKTDTRGLNFTDNKSKLDELRNGKANYTVKNLRSINTVNSDFGVTDYGNTILFSSPRKKNRFVKRSFNRNNENFLDIYKVIKKDISEKEGVETGVRPMFTDEINSKYHESSITFSPDRKKMFFTRNNYNKGVYKKDEKGYNNLKIYSAIWVVDKWKNVQEVPFNSNSYSTGHPSMSKDGSKLYFASDMPGGYGKTDLYVVDVHADGTYGRVKSLGSKVNTEGREMFPFISEENHLYFSSDGHFGIGALDVFVTKMEENVYKTPENLKAPINSKLDDFAFSINNIDRTGYLSSNREGGLGDDDIYAITELVMPKVIAVEKPICMQEISGIVKDKKFNKPLAGSKLILKDENGKVITETIADKNAGFSFNLPCNKRYSITASKEYYKQDVASFVSSEKKKIDLNLNFSLEIADEFMYNDRNELIVKIKPIYFDYNKLNIRPDAAVELNKVISVMKKHTKLEIRATSHTDARGRASYNEILSIKRAKSTVKFIISKGISTTRIVAKGFGETQLTNDCVDNDKHTDTVSCTTEEHQANRRTEFVITKM